MKSIVKLHLENNKSTFSTMKSFLQYVFTEYHEHALKDIYRTSDTRQRWNLKQKFHGIKDIPRIWVISLLWRKKI